MPNPANDTSSLYALLIGIDYYLPGTLPNGGYYPSLSGCVPDIRHVEDFLTHKLALPAERLLKLTASNPGAGALKPTEPNEQWPTYENMVAAFQKLTAMAQAGDQVYIHYSGHGGRARTIYPDLKGQDGLDETLVPLDIHETKAHYLRDVELYYLLKQMVDKGLLVTIVLDSCHSGGATRGDTDTQVRGMQGKEYDTTPRPTDTLVASTAELTEAWSAQAGRNTREVKPGSGWLQEPRGYVLLSACRAAEKASERVFEGTERNGALTYAWLDALKQLGPGLSYKMVLDRVLAKVHSLIPAQTPTLQGEGNRVMFGSDTVQPQFAVNMMSVDLAKQRVMLAVGQAQGVAKGAKFALYPPRTTDFSQREKRLALVEITERGAVESWATITERFGSAPIEQGAQAILLDPNNVRLQRAVYIAIDQPETQAQIERAITDGGAGFVRLVGKGEPAEFQVAVNDKGQYEIWDPAGNTLHNLRPELAVTDDKAASRLVQRLVHLTKYRNVQALDNRDAQSPLARKLVVEWLGRQADFEPGDAPDPQPFATADYPPTAKVGEWVHVRIRNNMDKGTRNDLSRILNITVLNLTPRWAITQVYPAGAGFFEPLDPQQEITLSFKCSLADDYTEGTDILKVFATLGASNFRWLELPALDQPVQRSETTRGGPGDPLEQLLAAMSVNKANTRDLEPAQYPSKEWITASAELNITRA